MAESAVTTGERAGAGAGRDLARSLTAPGLVAIGLGATIGAGIFVLTGTAAAQYAGPALNLSFVIGGIACGLVGLCYAELAAMIPEPGSTYTYTRASLGRFPAWIIGWDLVLEFAVAAATVAVGWSGYAQSLAAEFGLHLPRALAGAPGDGGLVNLPAAGIVLLLSALLMRATEEASLVNGLLVACKVAIILAFVGVGVAHLRPDLWHPFVPENAGTFGAYGWSGVFRGAAVVFFAFVGFETVATAAGECRAPQRDAPVGLIGSLLITTILYVAVAAVLTGLVPYRDLDVADPVAKAVDVIGLPGFSTIIKAGALIGLTTSALTALYGQSRIFFAIARDGLLPGIFCRVHPVTRVPVASQLVIGLFTAAVAGLVPIDVLGEIVSIGTLLAFCLVCATVLILRRTDPDRARPFRVPAVTLTAGFGILSCLALMASLPADTWIRLAVWLAIGLAIYAGYGRRHGRLS
ncbi:amino acid permease [Methylobacterium radiotolerans]|jgi:basic amino acid/polyamine antiporter, APA family|uniref:amino acid permease n=1 Tax=Methylobacterium TaxID=407 RepID=UPI0005EA46FB|nr:MULTISPECIES: amino acid permease [Methylobacterium]MBN6820215.1 amino acid permease [Methylobacterium organophilum]OXE38541.1 amino acid permease [Methylobacterium radiotolerans]GAN49128.1 amino acid permease-associated protein [Methylobacterium sp. ME121]